MNGELTLRTKEMEFSRVNGGDCIVRRVPFMNPSGAHEATSTLISSVNVVTCRIVHNSVRRGWD